MKYFIVFMVAVVELFFSTAALAGGDVGNGGDVIMCVATTENHFQGVLSLDYMLTLQNGSEIALVPVNSFAESMARISKIMAARCREDALRENRFSALLEKFLTLRSNHSDWSQPYIWNASAYGLVDVHDERMSRLLPSNCQTNGVPNIIQAIIRKKRADMGMIVFEYDPKIDSQLQSKPLQQSFLYMHEFLRNYISDSDQLRWLNWFLHSQQMEKMNDADFQKSINKLMVNAFCRS